MKKILIIDDNKSTLKLLEKIIQSAGFQAIRADNGKTGIEYAEKDLPDLILLDIQMPEISGFEVIKRLKSSPKTEHLKIVAVTASVMHSEEQSILSHGFDAYIPKPFFRESLLKKISDILNENS